MPAVDSNTADIYLLRFSPFLGGLLDNKEVKVRF